MAGRVKKHLRRGFTTGAAAAAAAKAAVRLLLGLGQSESVNIRFLDGQSLDIPVHACRADGRSAVCTVIKDAGDDPDVTHKAEIGARVEISAGEAGVETERRITITGGQGVGTVTKPGLGLAVGQAAINDGPRQMIVRAVAEVMERRLQTADVTVEIFVPEGLRLAEKTLNARLGIVGGLSILGTTGWVHPLSHEAYIATIRSAVNVAAATGCRKLVMTTGRRSERFAQSRWPDLPEESFVQIGDFFQAGCEAAARKGFDRLVLAVFFGKAVKMAQGIGHTHAAKSELTLSQLARWTQQIIGDKTITARVAAANTARHALEYLRPGCPGVIGKVGDEMIRAARKFAGGGQDVRGVMFDYDGTLLYNSEDSGS